MKYLALFAVISINVVGIYSTSKELLRATTILENPYVIQMVANSTKLEDYTGYIPDFLKKISEKIGRKFTIHVVSDNKYGARLSNGEWNGMIREVYSGNSDLAAAPITTSEERKSVVDFTEPFMTFDTLVIMKKGPSTASIRSAAQLLNATDIKIGVVKDGFTENFFKTSQQDVYKQMYDKMDKGALPTTSADGVKLVREGNGKYAFVIEAATADFWLNRQPCDLVSFRLGSALPFHDYSFAVKRGNSEIRDALNNAIRDLKSKGEHDNLRAHHWPRDCSGASFHGPTALSALLAVLTAVIGAIRSNKV